MPPLWEVVAIIVVAAVILVLGSAYIIRRPIPPSRRLDLASALEAVCSIMQFNLVNADLVLGDPPRRFTVIDFGDVTCHYARSEDGGQVVELVLVETYDGGIFVVYEAGELVSWCESDSPFTPVLPRPEVPYGPRSLRDARELLAAVREGIEKAVPVEEET